MTDIVEGMLNLVHFFSSRIKCGGPNYIAPGPLIAQFVDTEARVHAKQIRSHLSFLP